MRPAPDRVPIEELDRDILSLCTRINAATYELLVLVREFDERGGFLKWGLHTCAEWLAWRCDLSMTTALEKPAASSVRSCPSRVRRLSSGSTRQSSSWKLDVFSARMERRLYRRLGLRFSLAEINESEAGTAAPGHNTGRS